MSETTSNKPIDFACPKCKRPLPAPAGDLVNNGRIMLFIYEAGKPSAFSLAFIYV